MHACNVHILLNYEAQKDLLDDLGDFSNFDLHGTLVKPHEVYDTPTHLKVIHIHVDLYVVDAISSAHLCDRQAQRASLHY